MARESKEMKEGISTGSCAALAAKGAALLLFKNERVQEVDIPLPKSDRLHWPLDELRYSSKGAVAVVVKDAGDDPDVTHGARIKVTVEKREDNKICFYAGTGVGIVTLPGLALKVGEAAINPIPRKMIEAALREVTVRGVNVTVSVAGGEELAKRTFNPRLGIKGGISILGTSGRVRPFSSEALRDSLKCALDICAASGTRFPVFTPGNIGRQAANRHFKIAPQQLLEVSNEWGFVLEKAVSYDFDRLLLIGHPGKLGKLAMGQWQTHSNQSESALDYLSELASLKVKRTFASHKTVESFLMHELVLNERRLVVNILAEKINFAVQNTFSPRWRTAVALINLQGEILGTHGDMNYWH